MSLKSINLFLLERGRSLVLIAVFITFNFFWAGALAALDEPFECADHKAFELGRVEQELAKVQERYAQVETVQASFMQRSFAAALEISEVSSGEAFFLKPGKMRWHYHLPEEQIFVVEEQTLTLYQSVENQVIIDDFSRVLISDLPVSFLMGLGDLQRDFSAESGCQGEQGMVLKLRPKTGPEYDQQLRGFTLLVDPASYFPKGVRITDVGANQTTIILNDIKLNAELAPSVFKIDYPQGADLVDRRQPVNK